MAASHYKIMTCPSDNSERPRVYQRGYSFKPAATDRCFELNAQDDGNDYWPVADDDPLLDLSAGTPGGA